MSLSNILAIKNLPLQMNVQELSNLFGVSGKIEKIKIIEPKGSNTHIGIVVYADIETATAAIDRFNDYHFEGPDKPGLNIEYCSPSLVEKLQLSQFCLSVAGAKVGDKRKIEPISEKKKEADAFKIQSNEVSAGNQSNIAGTSQMEIAIQTEHPSYRVMKKTFNDLRCQMEQLRRQFADFEGGFDEALNIIDEH